MIKHIRRYIEELGLAIFLLLLAIAGLSWWWRSRQARKHLHQAREMLAAIKRGES